jgi:hypothetical protein
MRAPSSLRFLLGVLGGVLFIWAAVALWFMDAPLTILNAGQSPLTAKYDLLRQCLRSDIVVFGDSRVEAAIDPRLIDLPTEIQARAGGSLVEDFYQIRNYLACGNKPRLVILAWELPQYVRVSPKNFWQGSVIVHALTFSEQNEIVRAIGGPGDNALRAMDADDIGPYPSVPAWCKSILYELYFPVLYASNVRASLELGIVFRYFNNIRIYSEIVANHGRAEYRQLPHDPGPGHDVHVLSDHPDPAIEHYLVGILTMLKDREIPTMLMMMPINDATYVGMEVPAREGLMHYLNDLSERFPNLVMADKDLPRWPDQYFGDALLHLNEHGAAAVAATLNHCIPAILSGAAASSCGLAVPAL